MNFGNAATIFMETTMARQKITENFSVLTEDILPIKKFNEDLKIIERNGKRYKCVAAYTFPVSRPGEMNLNERIYPRPLWERVFSRNQGNGKFGLCDHANEKSDQPDGSVKDAFCVWHNGRFSEDQKFVLWDAYLFGSWGRHAKEAIDAGAGVGLSTVGYGEFLEDGKTIDPDTYDLDHPADWVLNPSYEVFGTAQDEISDLEDPLPLEQDPAGVQAPLEDSVKQEQIALKEKTMAAANTLKEREVKTFRLQIVTLMNEAEKKTTFAERQAAYSELLSYFEDGLAEDLRTQVQEKLGAISNEMATLAEAGKGAADLETAKKSLEEKFAVSEKELTETKATLQNKETELSAIKENYDSIAQLCDSLKAYSNRLKEMFDLKCAELETRITASEYTELQIYSENLEKELSELKKNLRRESAGVGPIDPLPNDAASPEKGPDEPDRYEGQGESSTLPETDHVASVATVGPTDMGPGTGEQNPPEDHPIPSDVPEIVADYFEDLRRRNPKVEAIRDDVLSCRTLIEAETTYLRLRSLCEDRSMLYHRDSRREVSPVVRFSKEAAPAGENGKPAAKFKIRKGWL